MILKSLKLILKRYFWKFNYLLQYRLELKPINFSLWNSTLVIIVTLLSYASIIVPCISIYHHILRHIFLLIHHLYLQLFLAFHLLSHFSYAYLYFKHIHFYIIHLFHYIVTLLNCHFYYTISFLFVLFLCYVCFLLLFKSMLP